MLTQLAVADRVTLVKNISAAGGDSLAGQNVQAFPEGALFYVASCHRFYQLKKNLNASVVATPLGNVVDGVGSSAVNGRFVAVQQVGAVALTAGSATLAGFDFTGSAGTLDATNWDFLVGLTTVGGTPGFVRAEATAVNIVTVTSASGSDTSTYLVVAVPRTDL